MEAAVVWEIAGAVISGISLLRNIKRDRSSDTRDWVDKDLEVDNQWVAVAIESGFLKGSTADYAWPVARRVPTLELKGTHEQVRAIDAERRILYRIVWGPPANRMVLMKKKPS